MKLCIPVCQPDGLDSMIQPHLPDAEHLLFFDLATRQYEHVSLREQDAGAGMNIEMDAVLCGSINRMILRQLFEQGIKVYGVETQTVAQAIARFENGELEAAVIGGGCAGHAGAHGHSAGGCCSGGGHDTAPHGCHGHGADEAGEHACHGAGGGCCGGHGQPAGAAVVKTRGAVLKIAVCSQNRKAVTEHAGKCRKFWIYEVSQGQVTGKTLLELPIEQSLHSSAPGQPHPLDAVDVLIAGGAGSGLTQRLAQLGIECVVTSETDLEQAVAAYLAGSSPADGALN